MNDKGKTNRDILLFHISQALKHRFGYDVEVTICDKGLMIHRKDLFNLDAPPEDVILTQDDCDAIMKCLQEAVDLAYLEMID